MIKVGDKVKFLNDVGGGIVRSISGKNIANVENEDGFEIPTRFDELVVVDNPDLQGNAGNVVPKSNVQSVQPEITAKAERLAVKPDGQVSFSFVFEPENRAVPSEGPMNVYLVNAGDCELLYNYSHLDKYGNYSSVRSGKMEANSKLFLEYFSARELGELPDFYFQFIPFRKKSTVIEKPLYQKVRVSPVRFFKTKSFQSSPFFKANVLSIALTGTDLDDEFQKLVAVKDIAEAVAKPETEVKPRPKLIVNADFVEIDLHIHELLDDTRGLSNHEMLEVQMKKFREELEKAIRTGVKRIVFIHGVGNGTLKQELRTELGRKYSKYAFQDASFQEYGFGATMVILKKN